MAAKTKEENLNKVSDTAVEETTTVNEPKKAPADVADNSHPSLEDEVKGLKGIMSEVLEYIRSQKASEESTQKTPEPVAPRVIDTDDERTDYVFPIDERDTGDLIIGVNGRIIRAKRGMPVNVPKSAIRCYLDSQEQKRLLYLQQKDLENKNLSD